MSIPDVVRNLMFRPVVNVALGPVSKQLGATLRVKSIGQNKLSYSCLRTVAAPVNAVVAVFQAERADFLAKPATWREPGESVDLSANGRRLVLGSNSTGQITIDVASEGESSILRASGAVPLDFTTIAAALKNPDKLISEGVPEGLSGLLTVVGVPFGLAEIATKAEKSLEA